MKIVNRTWITHGTWALAAIGTFGLGSLLNPTSGISGNTDASDAPTGNTNFSASRSSDPANPIRGRAERQPSERNESLLAGIFGNNSATGITALAQQALRDPNQITRRLAFSRLLESMTPENATTIRAQLITLGHDPDQWRDFHYAWGAIDGQAAFEHAAASPEQDLNDTMTGWAAANPTAALAMLENLPEALQGQRNQIIASVVGGLADRSLSTATDYVLELAQKGEGQASNLMDIIAQQALRGDSPEAASLWSDSLPDGLLKGAAMSRIAVSYARRDPEAAAAWVQRHASEDYAIRTIQGVTGQWVAENPQAAVGWLETLPEGNGQTAGLKTAFNDWEDRDPAGAAEYLLGMPSSPTRDSSISGFANGYAWQNPELAIQWAGSISDADLRQQSLTHAGRIFLRQNPAAARTWLQSSELPPEVQQQILNAPNR